MAVTFGTPVVGQNDGNNTITLANVNCAGTNRGLLVFVFAEDNTTASDTTALTAL